MREAVRGEDQRIDAGTHGNVGKPYVLDLVRCVASSPKSGENVPPASVGGWYNANCLHTTPASATVWSGDSRFPLAVAKY